MNPYDAFYDDARKLEAAEKRGDTRRIKELDFCVAPQCIRCSKPCLNAKGDFKPMQCARCHGVIYCGRDCQIIDWRTSASPGAPPHRYFCEKIKLYMTRIPYFQNTFKQFPWARIEKDKTFSHDLFKARIKVLGSGPSFGYWSVPGGHRPHDSQGLIPEPKRSPLILERSATYVHGEVLLQNEWPTDVEAWKLSDEKHVPHLFFTDDFPPPVQVKPGEVTDWASWYKWRGLDLSSPVALLMDFSLSAYHLLKNVLNVIDPTTLRRQHLEIHYLGAEVELNFLPLFSELALLLPNIDITLVIFGQAVFDLVRHAKKEQPGSLATQDTVWSYTAPKKAGGSSIEVKLYSHRAFWSREIVLIHARTPDAIIGCNAGILAYGGWGDPVVFSHILEIPFGVTDYAEQSMDLCAENVPNMLSGYVSHLSKGSNEYLALTKPRQYPVNVNPFHRPGQRPISVIRTPNYYNGFTIPIVAKDRKGDVAPNLRYLSDLVFDDELTIPSVVKDKPEDIMTAPRSLADLD